MGVIHAVLGAAMDGPASVPELYARLERDLPVWRFSESSVYDATKALASQGLLREVELLSGEDDARTYEMTGMGRTRLKRWVRNRSDLGPVRDDLRQQIAFSEVEDLPWLAARVERRLAWVDVQMEKLRDVGNLAVLGSERKPWSVVRLLVVRVVELSVLDGMARGLRRAHVEIVEAMERHAERQG
jgi:DNA-binding PadR family transcriptional regulator